jgi:O-antigen ligase
MATGLAIDSQADITNQFISAGVNAGLMGLILLVAVLVRCFQAIGSAMNVAEDGNDRKTERFLWGLGAAWIGTIAILFSVSYFDQMHVILYFLFALVCGFAFDETAREEEDAGDEALRETAASHEWQEVLVH